MYLLYKKPLKINAHGDLIDFTYSKKVLLLAMVTFFRKKKHNNVKNLLHVLIKKKATQD